MAAKLPQLRAKSERQRRPSTSSDPLASKYRVASPSPSVTSSRRPSTSSEPATASKCHLMPPSSHRAGPRLAPPSSRSTRASPVFAPWVGSLKFGRKVRPHSVNSRAASADRHRLETCSQRSSSPRKEIENAKVTADDFANSGDSIAASALMRTHESQVPSFQELQLHEEWKGSYYYFNEEQGTDQCDDALFQDNDSPKIPTPPSNPPPERRTWRKLSKLTPPSSEPSHDDSDSNSPRCVVIGRGRRASVDSSASTAESGADELSSNGGCSSRIRSPSVVSSNGRCSSRIRSPSVESTASSAGSEADGLAFARLCTELSDATTCTSCTSDSAPISSCNAGAAQPAACHKGVSSLKPPSLTAAAKVLKVVQRLRPLRRTSERRHPHSGRYECAYCFNDLCEAPMACLIMPSDDSAGPQARACKHLLHAACCASLEARARAKGTQPACPCCSEQFGAYVAIPDPKENPQKWFDALDVRKCGKIAKEEAMDALMAVLPIKTAAREQLAPGCERVNLACCKAVIEHFQQRESSIKRRLPVPVPKIEDHCNWFSFWDVQDTGLLTKQEVTRALMKTIRNHDPKLLRPAIDDVWLQKVGDEDDTVGWDRLFDPIAGIVPCTLKKVQAASHWKLLHDMTPM